MFILDLDVRWLLPDYICSNSKSTIGHTAMHCFTESICKLISDNVRKHKQL